MLRALTIANQRTCFLDQMYGGARMAAAGGVLMRVKTFATASTGGTAQTPGKRDPDAAAAATTWFNDATAITPGATPVIRQAIGFSAQGGFGGWVAASPEDRICLKPNAGATGTQRLASQVEHDELRRSGGFRGVKNDAPSG
jgi:hypothetical protein